MLTIRLTRKGKKNQPFFRIVVIDKKRSSKGGRAVEELGYVNPLTKKNSIKKERALYWLSVGAQASPRVHNLLVAEKIVYTKKIKVFNISKKVKAAAANAKVPTSQTNANSTPTNTATTTEVPKVPETAPIPEPKNKKTEEPKVDEKTM